MNHFASTSSYTSLALLPTTPVGTVALTLVTYNISVIGLKHLWYTLELVVKDYIQDVVLQIQLRYAMLLTLMFAIHQVFVEA